MPKDFKKEIIELLSPIVERAAAESGLQLMRILVRGTMERPVIEVVIDGERLVTIDDCASVSRRLSEELELHGQISGNYRLDVLSPGLEEPLVQDWQLKKNIGRLSEAELVSGEKVVGYLRKFSADLVELEPRLPIRRGSGPKSTPHEPVFTSIPRSSVLKLVLLADFDAR